MDYSDFQLANVGQPSLPPHAWHKTPKLAQDGLQFANSYHDLHMMKVDGYVLLKNLKFRQRMKWITVIFSWLMSGNLPPLMFWHKLLIQDVEHQNSHKTGCNLSNSFHNLHMNSHKTGCNLSNSFHNLHMAHWSIC